MVISQETLPAIKNFPKILVAQQTRAITQRSSRQWGFDVHPPRAGIAEVDLMEVFARQNDLDSDNFSCGIQIMVGNRKIMLSRYNGSDHKNAVAHYECHIHHATCESINRGDRKPEHADTQVTNRYDNLQDAFKCLCEDYVMQWDDRPSPNLFGEILL